MIRGPAAAATRAERSAGVGFGGRLAAARVAQPFVIINERAHTARIPRAAAGCPSVASPWLSRFDGPV